ncbi:orotate phosphoribosyl transferase [Ramicandelaber brevisporus]|nr:orotate phosphoribosyl transferase [Ramicandelaber brevisporus]
MSDFRREFVEFAIKSEILLFGSYTLKSGRQSPYFFNTGKFATGGLLSNLSKAYAALINSTPEFSDATVVFGPAYKGIPLATGTVLALQERHSRDIPFAFDRKEKKDHGEGGSIVGASLQGAKVLIVDDVITAGTAIRQAIATIRAHGGEVIGIAVAIDRMERGLGETELSAVQDVQKEYGVPVRAIVTLQDVISYLENTGAEKETLDQIRAYQKQYGTKY